MIPYEDIVEKTTYALTWNPVWEDDKRQLTVSKIDQFKCYLIAHFSKLKYSTLKVNIEFSPIGRLHIHGYITINDKFMFIQDDIELFTIFNTCIEPLKDCLSEDKQYKDWEEYISKQKLDKKYTNIELPYIPTVKQVQPNNDKTIMKYVRVKSFSPRKKLRKL